MNLRFALAVASLGGFLAACGQTSNNASPAAPHSPSVSETAPTNTAQPADQQVVGQTTASGTVSSGTGPGTTAITGGTGSSSTGSVAVSVVGDQGSTHSVTTNSGGSPSSTATPSVPAAVVAPTTTTQAANQPVTPSNGAPPGATGAPLAAPTIAAQIVNQRVVVGRTAVFTVVAAGTGLSYQWLKGSTAIPGATNSSYTTPPTVVGDNGSTFSVTVANASGFVASSSATLTVAAGTTPGSGTDVVTYKNDVSRTGQNLTETLLSPSTVTSAKFGLLRNIPVDGLVDAQPLYLSHLSIAGGTFNTLFVATEHDSVYAIDSDSGVILWQVSLLGSNETTSDNVGCGQITPEIGVTSTPVIDRAAGAHGTLFVVAMSEDANSNYHQRLHALDVTTGAELLNGPTDVTATFPNNSGGVSFDPRQYAERAALLLSNGTIYTSWTSHCDGQPYAGWVIPYSESTLTQSGVLNVAANSLSGPAIWMAGGGPAADSAGNIYLLTANGTFETTMDANGFPSQGDYGNSFVKISPASAGLAVLDYWTMFNEIAESKIDQDLGSGGLMLLPDMKDANSTVRHLAIGAGKDSNIYVVDRDSMGKFNANLNKNYQTLSGALPGGIWSTPAFFNNLIYYGSPSSQLKAFAVCLATVTATPASQSVEGYPYPGTAPSVSANGTTNGIVWAHYNTNPAVLRAYDALDLSNEIYNSTQAAGNRDQFGAGNRFITPTVADGKVFVGTTNSVAVFGLLP